MGVVWVNVGVTLGAGENGSSKETHLCVTDFISEKQPVGRNDLYNKSDDI